MSLKTVFLILRVWNTDTGVEHLEMVCESEDVAKFAAKSLGLKESLYRIIPGTMVTSRDDQKILLGQHGIYGDDNPKPIIFSVLHKGAADKELEGFLSQKAHTDKINNVLSKISKEQEQILKNYYNNGLSQ